MRVAINPQEPRMTPQQFIAKWKRASLSERSAAQQHFLDLCELLGQPKPADVDSEGTWYTFERGVHKTGGGQGWADVRGETARVMDVEAGAAGEHMHRKAFVAQLTAERAELVHAHEDEAEV